MLMGLQMLDNHVEQPRIKLYRATTCFCLR